ncbi:NAD(P)-dependent dehydrogenase (short-subunit alcohol dehydrogenase family) [Nocardioides daedukensis]|uniref:NAD(P)-dependent dehydrogenase (Short-subunit alcohol dehydrogenase family) n=1 Tax=Nocardioides daedukensis TaxID=634462 RepID=A0A7Y9UP64_9ACTN|nr:SDR family NAD(P)-dependent oxidoreductase [Nocardioides daedukensis]NYG59278.1 NAD(P)-dependent dehydrogenase (short-subunit alcohol dehydrogenase family) [Nocardioides daedukensis]
MTMPLPARALDTFLDRTMVGGYTRFGFDLRRRLPGWPADPAPGAIAGRHVLVTGASSGLGIGCVEALAELGATVHMVVRDEDKGNRVRERILERTPDADLHIERCDLADLDDVRRFARELSVSEVHAVIHNAGVMPPERTESPQGHELSMAVHVLSPVLMTELLHERLRDGRVILVSSGGMYAQRLPAADPEFRDGDYAPATAYARSKRMQVEMLPLLADRWSLDRITTAAMHPGWADTPGVQESLPAFRKLTRGALRDDEEGADTSVWLAATEQELPNGRFWHDRRPRPTHLVPGTRATADEISQAWGWLQGALEPN